MKFFTVLLDIVKMIIPINLFIKKKSAPVFYTPQGIKVVSSDATPDAAFLAKLDTYVDWVKQRGYKRQAKDITINLVMCGQTPISKHFAYQCPTSATGWAAGQVDCFNPIIIKMCLQTPEVLAHELLHVVLYDQNGNADGSHNNPVWRDLSVFY